MYLVPARCTGVRALGTPIGQARPSPTARLAPFRFVEIVDYELDAVRAAPVRLVVLDLVKVPAPGIV